jgi:threonine dehydrogenase-like Zn-dependent dehydrogenase
MRAAVIEAPGVASIEDVPCPVPGRGQVRVRVEGCGVCASNLPLWEGKPWFSYPLAPGNPGHEAWGRIDAMGEGVSGLEVGERVAIFSNNGYAEYDLASSDALVRLPPELDHLPFPGEALGCVMNIFQRSAIAAGDTVAIIGIGFLGALLTQLAASAGARVIAITRRPSALDVARRFGAAETVVMDDHWRIIEQVKELTDGRGCDCVIEAVGKQWPLDLAADIARESGRLVIAGYHQDGPRQVNMQLWNWRAFEIVNAHERDPRRNLEGMRAAARAVATGTLDPAPLYTHTFAVDELGDALDHLRDRPEGFMKALVTLPARPS